jgi:hypothetical protein
MAKVIHARLDDQTERLLVRLQRDLTKNTSEVVRDALRALASITPASASKRIIGLGQFQSGTKDLAANKRHLRGFGK